MGGLALLRLWRGGRIDAIIAATMTMSESEVWR